jgi:hypothetical protein
MMGPAEDLTGTTCSPTCHTALEVMPEKYRLTDTFESYRLRETGREILPEFNLSRHANLLTIEFNGIADDNRDASSAATAAYGEPHRYV